MKKCQKKALLKKSSYLFFFFLSPCTFPSYDGLRPRPTDPLGKYTCGHGLLARVTRYYRQLSLVQCLVSSTTGHIGLVQGLQILLDILLQSSPTYIGITSITRASTKELLEPQLLPPSSPQCSSLHPSVCSLTCQSGIQTQIPTSPSYVMVQVKPTFLDFSRKIQQKKRYALLTYFPPQKF